ncbi:unnamed protein product [Linum trigynum]|uniref:Uncharacterized protein n=1 Tax=Linum trigynum TaxID=586398 RepID=A0AAV2GKU0_9ROSI
MEHGKVGASGQGNIVEGQARSGSRYNVLSQEEETTASSQQRVNLDRSHKEASREKFNQQRSTTATPAPKLHQVWVEKSAAHNSSLGETTGQKTSATPRSMPPTQEAPTPAEPNQTESSFVEHVTAADREKCSTKNLTGGNLTEGHAGARVENRNQLGDTPIAMQAMHTNPSNEEPISMSVDFENQAVSGNRDIIPTGVPPTSL